MTIAKGSFFDTAQIGLEEAPYHIVEAAQSAASYHAVMKKRHGRVAAEDFPKYASRMVALCDEIYLGSSLELRKNKHIPLRLAAFAVSLDFHEDNSGEAVDIAQLTADSFREMFDSASSVVLDIRPRDFREDVRYSFAQVEWTREKPKAIFFYAQQGGRYDCEGGQRPLENLLLRKMFYVTGTAPGYGFDVKLGVGAVLDESGVSLY